MSAPIRIRDLARPKLPWPVQAVTRWGADAKPRGRHGAIDYRLEDFGLDAAERRAALRFYSEGFAVSDE